MVIGRSNKEAIIDSMRNNAAIVNSKLHTLFGVYLINRGKECSRFAA